MVVAVMPVADAVSFVLDPDPDPEPELPLEPPQAASTTAMAAAPAAGTRRCRWVLFMWCLPRDVSLLADAAAVGPRPRALAGSRLAARVARGGGGPPRCARAARRGGSPRCGCPAWPRHQNLAGRGIGGPCPGCRWGTRASRR